MEKKTYYPPEIILPDYWYKGSEMILRETLPPAHPEHPYNYIKRAYKVDPERYGIFRPEGIEMKEVQ